MGVPNQGEKACRTQQACMRLHWSQEEGPGHGGFEHRDGHILNRKTRWGVGCAIGDL